MADEEIDVNYKSQVITDGGSSTGAAVVVCVLPCLIGAVPCRNVKAYGQKAKHAASGLVFDKEVTLQTYGKDKYGRALADVFLPDGTHVNHTLVKDAWCWWYRKYVPLDAELERLEMEARDAKKGLWADPAPIPPWVYRKARRGQSLDLSDLVPLESISVSHRRGSPHWLVLNLC